MLLIRRQRCPASASCAGLQSRQLHADAGSARDGQAVVANEPAGEAHQNRRQGRAPWPLRDLPDGRGRGAEGIVPGNPAADRWTATKASPSVATGGADASSRRKECAWMPGKMARSPDRTSFGTAGTPEALRSPPMASRGPRRLLSFTPFQSSSGAYRFITNGG